MTYNVFGGTLNPTLLLLFMTDGKEDYSAESVHAVGPCLFSTTLCHSHVEHVECAVGIWKLVVVISAPCGKYLMTS